MKIPMSNRMQSLPPYYGGKRRLLRWIFGTLAKELPVEQWVTLTFTDLFLGGGSISLYAKAQGFKGVIANDLSERSAFIAKGLLTNTHIRLSELDLLKIQQLLPEDEAGFVVQTFNPSVFSKRHADVLDRVLFHAKQTPCVTKNALFKLLAWHLVSEFVCFSTSIGTSNRPYAEALDRIRDWQELNPKRFADGSFPRLLKPTGTVIRAKCRALNRGVMGGSPVTAFQKDAFHFLQDKTDGDILFMDPPYPQTAGYESTNKVLDAVLTGHLEMSGGGTVSPFSNGTEALEHLFDLAKDYAVWVLSYGNKVVDLASLKEVVMRHAPNRKIIAVAQKYRHLAHVSKDTTNEELLIIAIK